MSEIKYLPEAQEIMNEFPAWIAWVGLTPGDGWHAWLKHSTPILMFHDDDSRSLRQQIADEEERQRGSQEKVRNRVSHAGQPGVPGSIRDARPYGL